MSTAAEENVVSNATVERRFYTRVAPSGMAGILFGEDNPGMILNVSENGLLVTTPQALSRDTVFPLGLALRGLPHSVEVIGRVVWTLDTNRAGIQLLNLRDHDREQIRAWAALEAEGTEDLVESTVAGSGRLAEASAESVENPKTMGRRTFTRVSLAVGVAMGVIALAMGLTLRGSPMRSWLSHVSLAATKNVNGNAVAGTTSTAGDAKQNASAEGSATQAVADTGEKRIAGEAGADGAASTMTPVSSGKDVKDEKNAAKKEAAGDTVGADGAVTTSNERAPKSGQTDVPIPIPMGEDESVAASGATRGKSEGEESTGAGAGGKTPVSVEERDRQPEVAPKTSPVNAANAARVNPSIPLVIKMDGPKTEIVEITLPNEHRATLMSLPGERVIQSAAVTMHVQRAVVVDGGQGWWGSNRKKKVVLGELAERVDPQTPRQQSGREGRVSVRAIIGKDGRIESVRPVNGSIALVPSVVRAIREWRFEPTFVDGKPVETGVLLAVEFHAPESAASKPQ